MISPYRDPKYRPKRAAGFEMWRHNPRVNKIQPGDEYMPVGQESWKPIWSDEGGFGIILPGEGIWCRRRIVAEAELGVGG
jgi:hypothetical protein